MSQASPDQRLVVLLVEDEPLVRMLGIDILEDAGFAVIEAINADEALVLLDRHPNVSVLFTDVDMPGRLDGLELARVVHQKRPEVKLVIASGYVRPSPDELPDDGAFVPKPYEPSAVVGQIRRMITRH